MAIVRKLLASSDYTKIDNQVARNTELNDISKVLYMFIAGFKNGFQLNDEYIATALNWSRSKVTRAKKSLVKEGLLYVDKVDRQTYFIYIGNSRISAAQVKINWDEYASL